MLHLVHILSPSYLIHTYNDLLPALGGIQSGMLNKLSLLFLLFSSYSLYGGFYRGFIQRLRK